MSEYQPEGVSAVTLLVSIPGRQLHKLQVTMPGTATCEDVMQLVSAVSMLAEDRYQAEEVAHG